MARVSVSVEWRAKASTHLPKMSVTTRIYFFPLEDIGKGPMISQDTFLNRNSGQIQDLTHLARNLVGGQDSCKILQDCGHFLLHAGKTMSLASILHIQDSCTRFLLYKILSQVLSRAPY